MTIFKDNYCKRGKTERSLAKASIRSIQNRRGKDGEKLTRTLFNSYGPMERLEAYRMIDEAKKGAYFYRFVLSPDPKKEDHHHDLAMQLKKLIAEWEALFPLEEPDPGEEGKTA
jgi:hypothetical protein